MKEIGNEEILKLLEDEGLVNELGYSIETPEVLFRFGMDYVLNHQSGKEELTEWFNSFICGNAIGLLTNETLNKLSSKFADAIIENYVLLPKDKNKFNLEMAKAGAKVKTRSGSNARIVCFDAKQTMEPIIALIENECDGSEFIRQYTSNGKIHDNDISELDLIMAD